MEEYLKIRHRNLNRQLTQAREAKLIAPSIGLEKLAQMRIVAIEACIEEINNAQIQLTNETVNQARV